MFESDILHPFNSYNNYVIVFSSKLTVNVIAMLINDFVINIKKSCIIHTKIKICCFHPMEGL